MRRVAVVGCSGSGKTTLARTLARAIDCPHIELDALFHLPGWTELPDDAFREKVHEAVAGPAWVVDGNYSVVQDIVWGSADTVVWFDLAFITVMARVIRRTLRRTFLRTELWNGNREPLSNLVSLNPQKSIIAWSATRHRKYRERYLAEQRDPQWSGLTFVRLGTQADVRAFARQLSAATAQGGAP